MTDTLTRREAAFRADDVIVDGVLPPRRPRLWGRRAIAQYCRPDLTPERADRWLKRKLARGKRPPPVYHVGTAVVANPDSLDIYFSECEARARR